MNDDGVFETVFSASVINSYGYSSYSIDGERVYRSEFRKRGYAVPYFCNEDEYDRNEFSVVFLRGRSEKANGIRSVVSETQNTIKRLNSHYSVQ